MAASFVVGRRGRGNVGLGGARHLPPRLYQIKPIPGLPGPHPNYPPRERGEGIPRG